ncbi:hypothetical protein ASZ90_015774 [hydrocarbon metagenome]|uniref:Uncharacterized protein n=1 Tax=hydrocarbon metagenome TaxID=938273 RepID=A0A0W8F1W7_9ZZZZ
MAYYEKGYCLEVLGDEEQAAACFREARLKGYRAFRTRVRYHYIDGYSFY